MKNIDISYNEEISNKHKKQLLSFLSENAIKKKGIEHDSREFSFTLSGSHQELLAGIVGHSYYSCLHIDTLSVKEEFRNKGIGSLLLKKAEKEALKRLCTFMTVCTMDFEAKQFYEKHGFMVLFTVEGYEKNSVMHYMKKQL